MTPERPPQDACLFLDVDGTLIDIAPTPDSVVIPAGLIDDLRRAERAFGGALALVSGRSIAGLDRLFTPLKLPASGVHGAEFRFGDRKDALWIKAAPLPSLVSDGLMAVLDDFPMTIAENKSFSVAIHYRAVPASGPRLREALERFLAARIDLGLQILPGHCVFEIKRPDINKGAAIEVFLERAPFAGRRPVFIGDDVTDAPGFTVVASRGGWGYSVGDAFPGVSGTFTDPAAVRRWLASIDPSKALMA